MATKPILLAWLMLVGVLSGCAGNAHMAHHDRGPMAHDHGALDMQSMCAMHKQMFEGKTDAQRQALIDEHMKAMRPEMREHMQMMMRQCQ